MILTGVPLTPFLLKAVAMESPLQVARALLAQGIHTIPIGYGKKTVTRNGWQFERWEEQDLETQFPPRVNIGVLLGTASNGLVDCDLDTDEAIKVAPFFLPATGMVWGRDSKRSSHHVYFTEIGGTKNIPFKDPLLKGSDKSERAMLCELRVRGQTVCPPSVHPSGEHIEPEPNTLEGLKPYKVPYDALKTAMGRVAAASLLARYWTEGMRHEATLPLAGMLCRGGMDENLAVHFVRAVCSAAGETAEDTENRVAAVSDTYRKAEKGDFVTGAPTLEEVMDPKIVIRLKNWLELAKTGYTGDVGPDGWPLSDIGNAERFAERWRGSVVCCVVENAWYLYNGKIWEPDKENRVLERAMAVVNDFRTKAYSTATVNRGNTSPDQWRRHADQMGKQRQIKAMLELATALVPVTPDVFDADPLLLNTTNSTLELDITKGDVYSREHRADDYCTMMWSCAYEPGATHLAFEEYLERFFPEPERRAFLQEMVGYTLTGIPKRYSLQLIGPTHSGKSMTLRMFGEQAGTYGSTLKFESLMRNASRGGDAPRPDLWAIRRTRLVTASEIPPGTTLDVALFKSLLSGGDKVRIRTLFDRSGGADVSFNFALWTSGNQPYGPPPSEEAAYERMLVLRCEHQVEQELRSDSAEHYALDPMVTGPAVLHFAIEGFKRLYGEKQGRIISPDFVKAETRKMQDALDPWAEVVAEVFEVTGDSEDCVLKHEVWEYASAMYVEHYGAIRKVNSEKYNLEATLKRSGARLMRSNARWGNREHWTGLRFLNPDVRITPPDWTVAKRNEG